MKDFAQKKYDSCDKFTQNNFMNMIRNDPQIFRFGHF